MKRLALIAALSAIALPAMAQYVVQPYGNGTLLVTPYKGTTLNHDEPFAKSFVIPDPHRQDASRPCTGFTGGAVAPRC